ncbi:MAG: hypothetical protein Q4A92_00395 [Corynebacterium sp.]|nr:hypothetical protein [Corynebacterium sp.]
MNTTVLRTAYKVTRAGLHALNDYRQRKAVEAYDALADAAAATSDFRSTASERAEEFMEDAGAVTRAARARLDSAFSDALEDASTTANKVLTKAQSKLQKVEPEPKKKCCGFKKVAKFGLLFTLLAGIAAGVAYWFFAPVEEPEITPPRVDDFEDEDDVTLDTEDSVLVYSTETPVDEATKNEKDA